MNVFRIIQLVLPIALEIVPLVERLFGDADGETKREAAVALIKPSIRAVEAAKGGELVDEDALTDYAGQTVDGVVGILNETGVFQHRPEE